jgi:putative transposase
VIEFKASHSGWDMILWGIRGYVAHPISHRQLEGMMRERGVEVGHTKLNRWVIKIRPAAGLIPCS